MARNIQITRLKINVPAETRRNHATNEVETIKPAGVAIVELRIDLTQLERGLCLAAARNKTGRAVTGSGAVVAKLVR